MNVEEKMPLTVLHIFSGDLWAGAEVMTYNLCKGLNKDPGLKVLAISFNEGVLTGKLRDAGVEIYVIPEAETTFPRIISKALQILRGREVDIIHSHRFKENLLALLIAKNKGVRNLAATVHGMPESPLRRENSTGLKTKLNYLILKKYFSIVVAVSREIKKNLVASHGFSNQQVDVIHNGIPLPEVDKGNQTPPPSDGKDLHIGTVGRMVPVKDFGLFLEIAAGIKAQGVNCRFSILGDGPQQDELATTAKTLGIEDIMDFLPARPDPLPYYRSLDIYLNTSIHEGIPLSVLEAMSCGIPVVAPMVGGIPEIITNGTDGILVGSRKPEDFVNSCMRLIGGNTLRTYICANASKTIADRFTDAAMTSAYAEAYRTFHTSQTRIHAHDKGKLEERG